jgi:hypothetical protein
MLEQDLHFHTLRRLPPMNSENNITSTPTIVKARSPEISSTAPIRKTMMAKMMPLKFPVEMVFLTIFPSHCLHLRFFKTATL